LWPYSSPYFLEITMSSWGCPHEIKGLCAKVNNLVCDPGMKGCELAGRYVFVGSEDKNKRLREKQAQATTAGQKPSK
jgi:hypothetical protein